MVSCNGTSESKRSKIQLAKYIRTVKSEILCIFVSSAAGLDTPGWFAQFLINLKWKKWTYRIICMSWDKNYVPCAWLQRLLKIFCHANKYTLSTLAKVEGKKMQSNPITGLDRPWGFQEDETPRFQDNRHMKAVRSPVLRTGRLYLLTYSMEQSPSWGANQ